MQYRKTTRTYPSDVILKYRDNFNKFMLNEGFFETLKAQWDKVKGKFKNIVSRLIKNEMNALQTLDDEIVVTIPAGINNEPQGVETPPQDIDEGALSSIKGNYNEVLTVKYVIDMNGVAVKLYLTEAVGDSEAIVVTLDSDGKKHIPEIDTLVKKWDTDLRKATKSKEEYSAEFNAINIASRDMAEYIMAEVGKNEGNILEIFLDNLSFKEGAEFKADIRMRIRKALGESIMKAYSLKMYKNPKLTLWNPSKLSVIRDLIGVEAEQEFIKEFNSNSHILKLDRQRKDADSAKKRAAKLGNTDDVVKFRKMRDTAGSQLNPIISDMLYAQLVKFIKAKPENTSILAANLMKMNGLNDRETGMLLSLVGNKQIKRGKSDLITKHPELDLSQLRIEHTPHTVNIKIYGSKSKKPLIILGAKEGKNVSSNVDFSSLVQK